MGQVLDSLNTLSVFSLRTLRKVAPALFDETVYLTFAKTFVKRYPDIFEVRSCPACGGSDFIPKFAGSKDLLPSLYPGSPQFPKPAIGQFPLIYVECQSCFCGYINPSPNGKWIDNDFPNLKNEVSLAEWMEEPAYILDKKKSIEYLYRRFDLNRFRTNLNSILDVSCGSGVGLAHLRDTFGWKRMCGVEFDSGAIRYGNEKRGLEIHQGTIYQHPFSEGSFDIVTMDNSLEHHSMPEQALKKIKALLRPGGALLIIVPNFHGESVDSEGINYCNLNWGHWSYFTVQSLCELLDRRGFKVEQVFTGNCRNSEMAECKHAKDVCHESTGESVRKLKKHDHLFRGNFINLLARC